MRFEAILPESELTAEPETWSAAPLRSPFPLHWAQAIRVRWAVLATLLIGVVSAPFIYYPHDFWNYWFDWEYQSLGLFPWRPYAHASIVCDYPPLELYLLTLADAFRRLLGGLSATGAANLLLIKGPWILAWSGGCALVAWAARGISANMARPAALAWACALPLYVNAALWGQADVLLSFLLVGSIALLWKDRYRSAAAVFGLALSLKLQAIFMLPVLVIYAWRRWGLGSVVVSAGIALLVVFLMAVPMAIGGEAHEVARAYSNAVDLYPVRTVDAFNLWFVYDFPPRPFDGLNPAAVADTAPVCAALPWLSCKHLALGMLTLWVATIGLSLWRTPTRTRLAAAAALCVLGTFTLSTQMHDRYGLPAVGLLAMVAWAGRREAWVFVAVAFFAGVNQFAALENNWLWSWGLEQKWEMQAYANIGLSVSILSTLVLIYAGVCFVRGGWRVSIERQD